MAQTEREAAIAQLRSQLDAVQQQAAHKQLHGSKLHLPGIPEAPVGSPPGSSDTSIALPEHSKAMPAQHMERLLQVCMICQATRLPLMQFL